MTFDGLLNRGCIIRFPILLPSYRGKAQYKRERFLVANLDCSDQMIYCLKITSKIERFQKVPVAKANSIYLEAGTLKNFEKNCVIDLQQAYSQPRRYLADCHKEENLDYLGTLPANILSLVNSMLIGNLLISVSTLRKIVSDYA